MDCASVPGAASAASRVAILGIRVAMIHRSPFFRRTRTSKGTDCTHRQSLSENFLVPPGRGRSASDFELQQMKLIRSLGLGSPFPHSISTDFGLLLIRLATGIFLCTVFEKFLPREGRWGPQDWFIADVAKMGFPFPILFAWCAVLSEFFGGILLALGLLARPAAFFNAITTFVAAFIFHKGDVSGSAMLGTVFFASTMGLTLTGPGRLSIDYVIYNDSD